MIPFLDLKAGYLELKEELDEAIARVLESGWYVLGEEVEQFESAFGKFTESEHCVGLGNGLDALTLGLKALGVGAGDEVIVPSNTYIATWLAVTHCGARPVPVEPLISTSNLDPGRIEEVITKKTKVIIPVHLYGQAADLDPILDIARQYGVKVLEDAAQAHGAKYKNNFIGGHGDIVAWSFYPGKNLGAFGDGGAVTTNNPQLADRVRVLRNYGSRIKYLNEVVGYNSRLDPVQAAVLRVKLAHLDEWNARRKVLAARYLAGLAGCGIGLPEVPAWADPVWHLFVVRHPRRDDLQRALNAAGIGNLIHYPTPPHRQQAYAGMFAPEAYPIANQLAAEVLSLPMGPQLSAGEVDRVIDCVRDWAGRA